MVCYSVYFILIERQKKTFIVPIYYVFYIHLFFPNPSCVYGVFITANVDLSNESNHKLTQFFILLRSVSGSSKRCRSQRICNTEKKTYPSDGSSSCSTAGTGWGDRSANSPASVLLEVQSAFIE